MMTNFPQRLYEQMRMYANPEEANIRLADTDRRMQDIKDASEEEVLERDTEEEDWDETLYRHVPAWEQKIACDILELSRGIAERLKNYLPLKQAGLEFLVKNTVGFPLHFVGGTGFVVAEVISLVRTFLAHQSNAIALRELDFLQDEHPVLFDECMQALKHFQIFPDSADETDLHFEDVLSLIREKGTELNECVHTTLEEEPD